MILIDDSYTELKHKTFIALGSFDGIHLGHLELIKKTVELAKENNCHSMVYTFGNHPMTLIAKERAPKLIQSNSEKIAILESVGIDFIKFQEFNVKCMNTECEDFVWELSNKYNAAGIIVGFNYTFGKGNKGNVELLAKLCKKYNLMLHVCPPYTIDGNIVSSTFIRGMIKDGQVKKVQEYLGRYFSVEGIVTHGREIGRTIGFPTANLLLNSGYIIPKRGVYFTMTEYNKTFFKSITNVGYNPTVNGDKLNVETHLLHFDKNIYGDKLKVHFVERLRDEKKFSSLDDLKNRLSLDKDYVDKKEIIL